MALYSYQAFSKDGKKISGTLEAASVQAARDNLSRSSLYPIKIEMVSEKKSSWWQKIFTPKISIKDKIFFTKQLAILLKAGVPIVDAMGLLSEQTEGRLKKIVIEVKDNLKEGKTLADSLAKYPSTFETLYIQLVKAGEASGRLEIILDRLTAYLERRQEITSKVKSALRYPLIQLGIVVIVVCVLLIFVVPQITEVFESKEHFYLGLLNYLLICLIF